MAERIQIRRDTPANWAAQNPVLAQGEPGYDLDNQVMKVGDGVKHWADLPDIQTTGLAGHIDDDDNPHKVTAAQAGADPAGTASSAVTSHEEAEDPHSQYIQKVTGKGLSTEDYTTSEKDKLAGIEAAAQVNQVNNVDGQTGEVDLSSSYERKRQNNLTATGDPAATDDETAGYEPLSRWINTITGEIWLCVDATEGAAGWQTATLTLDELGSAALVDAGKGSSQIPRNSDLGSATFEQIKQPATTTTSGVIEKATPSEMDSGTADKYPDAAGVHRFVSENAGGAGSPGLFNKSDGAAPAWETVTSTSLQTASTITAVTDGLLAQAAAGSPIEVPNLSPGTDYYIYLASDGSLQALDAESAAPSGERLVGGFHVLAGDGEINPRSCWDLNWRPQSNPRGMTLSIDGKLWGDTYLMDAQYGVNGYSRNGATIADDGSRPVIPGIYGGDGIVTYGTMSWWVAVDLATAAGKRLPCYQEFTALAYGVVERQAVGTDPVTTQHQAGHRSACGCEQITGVMYQWGADIAATGGSSWRNITEGRGDVYASNIVSPLFGAYWNDGSNAGSRASNWSAAPDYSLSHLSARGVSDHLNLQAER